MGDILRDMHGYKIAEVKDDGTTRILCDRYGTRLGRYETSANMTFDQYGNQIGWGDQLATLLGKALNED